MTKTMTCIECPKGCRLTVDIENCKVVKVAGNECPKGEKYAIAEVENPTRILTTTILTEGLDIKLLPVRTDKPIPKEKLSEAMGQIKKMKLRNPVCVGDVVVFNFLNLQVNLIAIRDAK